MREGWATTTLGEVAEVVSGGTPSTSTPEFWDGDVTWITPTEVTANEGKVIFNSVRRLTTKGLDSSSAKLLPVGSVLLTSRATIGAVALAGTELSTNQGFASLIAGNDAIPRFLMYWCQQNKAEFESRAAGNTFKEISRKKVAEIPLHLPPLAEQRRIVDVIESVDNYITALETRAETARTARSALVESAIAELMKAECVPLNSIAQVVGGVTKDSGRTNSNEVEVPYLRVANVQRARLDLSEVKKISVNAAKADALKLENGDILLNEGGDRDKLGRGWVWEGQIPRCIHQNHVFRARVFDPTFDPYFIAIITNSEIGRSWFEMMGGQSTNLASISKGTLEQFPVPCADQSIQGSILEFWNALSDTAAACDALTHDARRLRSALLSDLLSGNHEIPATYDQLLQAA
jgi:type I restriction enzyme S subunit